MLNNLPKLIQLNVPFIFLLLIAAAAVGIAVYLYGKNPSELSKFSKYILISLRGIIVFLVILLFFTPSFFLSYQQTVKPKLALFIDNSKSMNYKTNRVERWEETKEAIKKIKDLMPANAELFEYEFNSSIDTVVSNVLNPTEKFTNFNPVLNLLKETDFDKSIIVSDGNQTEGNYPISNDWPSDTKIYTVGIGEISSGSDLAINNVSYQPVTYPGTDNKIEVQIRTENLEKKSDVNLKYYLNGKLIQQKKINLKPGSYNEGIDFDNIYDKPGLNKLMLEVDAVNGETNILNNKYTFVQNVLNNKIKIGLFSGVPGYESKFIAFLLNQIEDFELSQFIGMKNGSFYNQTNLNKLDDLDILIFCGFPGLNTSSNTINHLLSFIKTKQPSLILYLNDQTDLHKLLQFIPWLPYEQLPANIKSREISITNPLSTSINPLLFIFDDKENNREFWSKTPPVVICFSGGKLKPSTKVLLSGSDSRNQFPLILYNDQKNQRAIVFNGEGYWKWHFLLQDNPHISAGYQKFLINLLRWANDRSELKPVILKTEKNVAHPGETIHLNGYIYDGLFKPVRDGELIVEAEWNQQKFDIESVNDSVGGYEINFVPPGEGKYILTARGFRDGVEIGSDKLELEVIPIEKEYIYLDQNREFLKKLAEMGNGYYVDAANIDSLAPALIEPDKIIMKDRVIDIWYHPILLTIIIILISAEWILRKRLGLV